MSVRVGDRGRSLSSLHPQGFVEINGKQYDARSEYDPIQPATEVVVVSGDLQGLVVRKIEPGLILERLPGYGKPVHSSFGELLGHQQNQESAEREAWQARRPRWRAARQAYALQMGSLLGALFACAGIGLSWDYLNRVSDSPWLIALAVVGIGIGWSVGVFCLLDRLQQRFLAGMLPQFDERVYDRLTLFSTGLGLLGATVSAVLVIPRWGLEAGYATAIFATCLLGLVVPGFLILTAPSDE